jgi:hypothetical protein
MRPTYSSNGLLKLGRPTWNGLPITTRRGGCIVREALPILSDIGAPSVTGPAGTVSEVVLAVEPVNIMC